MFWKVHKVFGSIQTLSWVKAFRVYFSTMVRFNCKYLKYSGGASIIWARWTAPPIFNKQNIVSQFNMIGSHGLLFNCGENAWSSAKTFKLPWKQYNIKWGSVRARGATARLCWQTAVQWKHECCARDNRVFCGSAFSIHWLKEKLVPIHRAHRFSRL